MICGPAENFINDIFFKKYKKKILKDKNLVNKVFIILWFRRFNSTDEKFRINEGRGAAASAAERDKKSKYPADMKNKDHCFSSLSLLYFFLRSARK